jgi:hypothetical protein
MKRIPTGPRATVSLRKEIEGLAMVGGEVIVDGGRQGDDGCGFS